tara:strand:- start:32889 stop:33785 length:897 start_codon:yes stop_codon:yes gene_type:complete
MFSIQGSIVALITPMNSDGSIDLNKTNELVDWHIKSGTSGIVVVGTTGESATLDVAEHVQIIEHVVDHANERIKIIAGTGANSTKEAIYLTAAAKKAGANAALLVTPYYNKPSQAGLKEHYESIANEVDIPQILYNVPSRTGCDMESSTVVGLSQHENIIGIKEATGSIERLLDIKEGLKTVGSSNFLLLSGDDFTATDFILNGGKGTISVTANVIPETVAKISALALAGNKEDAYKLDSSISKLNQLLFIESNPIPVKWILNRMGIISEGIRLPLTKLDIKFHKDIEEELKALDLIS